MSFSLNLSHLLALRHQHDGSKQDFGGAGQRPLAEEDLFCERKGNGETPATLHRR